MSRKLIVPFVSRRTVKDGAVVVTGVDPDAQSVAITAPPNDARLT
jgi:hypothetical protein